MAAISAGFGGGTIDSGDDDGTGTVTVATDIFAGSCEHRGGTWTDQGYNVGRDGTCFNGGTGDSDAAGSNLSNLLGPPADNGGPTQTMALLVGNPAIGIVPDPTSGLCPVVSDQPGVASPSGAPCDAGAVQLDAQAISFHPPATGSVGDSVTLSATGGPSGNPVVFSVDPTSGDGVCSVSGADGATLRYSAAGACVVDANQAGDDNDLAAPQLR